jgi:hypothetical protein
LQERGGVYLPPRKAMIFDTIKNHPGIHAEGVAANCFPFEMSVQSIRTHIVQINDFLAGTDLRIKGDYSNGKTEHGGYRIVCES